MAKSKPTRGQLDLFSESLEATEPAKTSPKPPQLDTSELLPPDWHAVLGQELNQPYFLSLQKFLQAERTEHQIHPEEAEVFAALHFTPWKQVRVVLLGQDPYPTPGHAHGLAFSVKPGVALPASLRNLYRELESDLGIPPAGHGYLAAWAKQGVLLLNTVLTVRSGQPASHANQGWERFTDAVLHAINTREQPSIFLLFGNQAQKKAKLIDRPHHAILKFTHPSPLSAHQGFFGSKPFSRVNQELEARGLPAIDWRLPEQPEA